MLSIRAIGCASPLGGLLQAGAAFRAGISRVSPVPDVELMESGDEAPQAVSGHALASSTLGFSGVGRLVALLVDALRDLHARRSLVPLPPELGLFLALPDPAERGFTLAAEPGDEDPEAPDARRLDLGKRLAAMVGGAAGLELSRLPLWTAGEGHAAFPTALAMAQAALQGGQIQRALVAAVDSLVATEVLELLLEAERVKTDQNPVGFVPGEAAVAVLLDAQGREPAGAEPGLRLLAVARAEEDRVGSDRPPDGRALAKCVREVVAASAPPAFLVSDHDGEPLRAAELGCLRVQLQPTHPALAGAPTWYPATCFGNTGAASAGVGLAVAAQALRRGVAPAPSAVVLSSADSGSRAAVHLGARSGGPAGAAGRLRA